MQPTRFLEFGFRRELHLVHPLDDGSPISALSTGLMLCSWFEELGIAVDMRKDGMGT